MAKRGLKSELLIAYWLHAPYSLAAWRPPGRGVACRVSVERGPCTKILYPHSLLPAPLHPPIILSWTGHKDSHAVSKGPQQRACSDKSISTSVQTRIRQIPSLPTVTVDGSAGWRWTTDGIGHCGAAEADVDITAYIRRSSCAVAYEHASTTVPPLVATAAK